MIDLEQALVNGVLGAIIGLLLGGIVTIRLMPRIKAAVREGFLDGMNELLADMSEKPEGYVSNLAPVFEKVIQPIIGKYLGKFGMNAEGEMKDLKIGPLRIPGPMAAMFGQAILNRGAKQVVEKAADAVSSNLVA